MKSACVAGCIIGDLQRPIALCVLAVEFAQGSFRTVGSRKRRAARSDRCACLIVKNGVVKIVGATADVRE